MEHHIENKKIAVLLTCHNRKQTTLNCLAALYNCTLPESYALSIYLVDDGSTDGTGVAIRQQFPMVNIIQGNGKLYWNRGMHLAWKTAVQENDFEYYLWLNDDTIIYPESLSLAINEANNTNNISIICGATEYNGICSYSSFKRIKGINFTKLIPNGRLQLCEVFNGNFVLIPKRVFKIVGNLDKIFTHSIGDFDYGLRAHKLGIKSFLLQKFIGNCKPNNKENLWERNGLRYTERLRLLYSPLGNNPILFSIYLLRHFGLIQQLKYLISVHFKVIFYRSNTIK